MALKRAWQWWDQQSTTFGLAPAEPARPQTQALELDPGLDPEPPLPFGWEKCFDLKTGDIFFKNTSTGMRTATDPRVLVKLLERYLLQQQKKDVDSDGWRGLSRSLDTEDVDPAGDKAMDSPQKFRGFEASTIDEKVSKWSQNYSWTKTLPPLLTLKTTDGPPSLDLSLRLEGPHSRDSSSPQLSTTPGDKPGSLKENAGHVKLEQQEQCHQNFLGPNHNMGPFPSNFLKVKEEPTPASLCWRDQSPVGCNLPSSTFPISTSSKREGTEISPTSALKQPEFRDWQGPRYAMGPFSSSEGHALMEPMPSSVDQSSGTCTLDKVMMALKRTQTKHETAVKSRIIKTNAQASNSLAPSSGGMMVTQQLTPLLLQPLSTQLSSASASLSPTTSDASSAVSSKLSVHSTSPSMMSFQGEELDELGGQGSSPEAKTRSNVVPTSAPGTLVLVGCTSCHMFVMLSKDNPNCPKCGNTCSLDISPPRKRRRQEGSPVGEESQRD
ncbi:unnamed protein product [Calypogeia fissa]